MFNKKEIIIKVDKDFIENCVYQENWGSIYLEEKDLKENLSKYIKDSCETIVREVIKEVMIDIIKKELKKELKDKVKAFLIGMADSELFYRDEFRAFIVSVAKENKNIIDKKVKSFLENNDDKFSSRIADAIGNDMNNRFFQAIVDGKISN